MSNQLKLAALKTFVRANGMVGFFPCLQTIGEGTQCLDRSGAGNNAAFGTALLASAAWAGTNRLTIAANASGVNAGAPFITAAQLNLNYDTDSLMVAGVVNTPALGSTQHILGTGSDNATKTGWALRLVATTGKAQMIVHGTTANGGTIFGTASGANLADGTDHPVIVLIDGPRRRMFVFIDGIFDATANGSAAYTDGSFGLPFSAAMASAPTLQVASPLFLGGQSNTLTSVAATAYTLTPASTSYAWQVAVKRGGSPPVNFGDVAKRLARHPLQILSAAEWP